MLNLNIFNKNSVVKSVLFLGAHCDDIEIGCGGTILRIAQLNPGINIHWVVFSSNKVRAKEAESSAKAFLSGIDNKSIIIKSFKDSFFPYVGTEIKEYFEELKSAVSPDLIFTHYGSDRHQDHRTISELTWNTFRNHMILEYEIAKYDGDLGNPNCFVNIEREIATKKLELLSKHYTSQRDKQWFGDNLFMAMMRIRGIECNAAQGLAEAFYSRKAMLS